jgi:hypothetical protein
MPPPRNRTIREDLPESGDEVAGLWSREQLLNMDAAFVARVAQVLAQDTREPDRPTSRDRAGPSGTAAEEKSDASDALLEPAGMAS